MCRNSRVSMPYDRETENVDVNGDQARIGVNYQLEDRIFSTSEVRKSHASADSDTAMVQIVEENYNQISLENNQVNTNSYRNISSSKKLKDKAEKLKQIKNKETDLTDEF